MGLLSALGFAAGMGGMSLAGQSANTAKSHIATAKAAAGNEHVGLFNILCTPLPDDPAAPTPPRSSWHVEPVKVFDNLILYRDDGGLRLGSDDFGRHHRGRRSV